MISRRLFLAATGGALTAHALAPYRVATEPVPGALDHIILGVSDLDRGIDFVEQRSGVRAVFRAVAEPSG